MAVALAYLAFRVRLLAREVARAVVVQVRRQHLPVERVQPFRVPPRDMTVTELLADDCPFLLSARALSLVRLARDFVNSSTRSFSSKAATW